MDYREEIKEKIDEMDEDVFLTIIDCIKELNCKGVPMYNWDYDSIMDVFDKVMTDNGY